MNFITDAMLGKLTRWLRMLGQNVKHSSSLSDKQLIKTAKKESRILLTRDFELCRKAKREGVISILVYGTTKAEKLACLAKRFNLELEIDVAVSRCPKCNTKIKPVPRDEIIGRVPKTTLTYYHQFWKCPGCSKVYWQGAHWCRIERTLGKAKELAFRS